jgi:hypothetical protein
MKIVVLTKDTLIDFRYMYDPFSCGDEKLWFKKGEGLGECKVTKDNGDKVDLITSDIKIIKDLPKDSFKMVEA